MAKVGLAKVGHDRDVANQERTAQTGFKRLRLTRLSQATTVVVSSGGERATLQEMSHIQDTMEDIDTELDDRGPGVAAFDPRIEPPVLAVTQRGSEGEGVEGPLLGVQSSVTVAPADPNAPGRVMGVAEVVDMATPRGQTHQEICSQLPRQLFRHRQRRQHATPPEVGVRVSGFGRSRQP